MSIAVEELLKRYGGLTVVNRVSLEVRDAELFVLLGASGSGKSTVLRLIAGLTAPDGGRILLRGRDVTALPPQERGIGFVFQNYSIFRHMSVAENLEFGLRIRKVAPAERARRREQLLDLVGLGGLGARYGHQLSGGQLQRVALARALAYEPSVLLLDEPFGALDVKIRGHLRRNLKEIQRQLGVTTVLVTHDQEEAFELADRVGIMERGSLLEVGEPEELYARPRTLFGATFVGAGTVLVGRARDGRAQLGPLALPIPAEVEHEEDARVRVLFRPEQVALASADAAPPPDSLGTGEIVESNFLGALRRVRVRLPPIAGARQASPALYGEEGLLVDAVLGAGEEVPGPQVQIGLRGWHVLAPPQPRLLFSEAGREGSPGPFPLADRLVESLDATACLLEVAQDADQVDALRGALGERAAALGLHDAEGVVRRGDPGEEIAAEQAQNLYDFVVLAPGDGREADLLPPLLERLNTPLLVLRGPALARFLICTKVGEPGKSDVKVGGWLARRLGAEATLLHVNTGAGEPERWVGSHLAQGLATLHALEVPCRSQIRRARTPVEGILAEAAEGGYDLIVLGRPAAGRTRAREDIAFDLLRGSRASLLIVPAEE
jgi:sulfate transport system ATP-binding protein